MEFNGTKFVAFKYGKKAELKEDYNYYNSDCTESISDVESLRDLGIILSCDGSFRNHITKVISKCKQKVGWINRSFLKNSVDFKRTIWRSHVQSIIDYGSQIWAPIDICNIAKIEQLLKSFSKGIQGLENSNYWERLEKLRLSSIQRRMER